ncbi:YhgE/Pip domain-containing protein [Jonesia quinghaiensis]|uniref:YhgE/Pip domain-containing protein n=1 Tax=Jonesia quinghaiensis TaxID=262806 RepID=UPI00041FB932|nr:YhgE/Pip domain-containing protein [Jonesia quinghaiensis]
MSAPNAPRRMPHMTRSTTMNFVILAIIACIPLMYAGLLSFAYQDPVENVSDMKAAVVNLDSAYTTTLSTGDTETFDLGAELENTLTDPADGEDVGFTWKPMTEDEAKKALTSEDIRAYMVIPENFSATAGTLGTPQAATTQPVKLDIVTDDSVNYLTGTMARTVAVTLQDRLSAQAADQYINTVLVSMTSVHDGFSEAADGSNTLAEGATDLHEGLVTLDDALTSAHDGAGELANGAGELANGAGDLAAGTGDLSQGATRLSGGVGQLHAAIPELADGASQLAGGVDSAHDGATALASGATTLQDGVGQYTKGVDKLADGIATLAGSADGLRDGAQGIDKGAASLNKKLGQYADASGQFSGKVTQLSAGQEKLATSASALNNAVGELAAQCTAAGGAAQFCASLDEVAQQHNNLADSASTLSTNSAALSGAAQELTTSAGQLAEGSAGLATGASQLSTSIGKISDTAADKTVLGALNSAQQGAEKLSDQSGALRKGVKSLSAGATSLSEGTNTLATGAQALTSGLPTLTDSVGQLDTGARHLAAGANKAATGAQQLATGAGVLADGANTLNGGLGEIGEGANDATNGAEQLADGSTNLWEALSDGAEQVPTYTEPEQQSIAETASAIADVSPVRLNAVHNAGAGFAPMFMALSLWIGGIALFLVMPALDRRHSTTEKWWMSATRPMAIAAVVGVVQATLAMVLVNTLVELNAENLWGLIAIAVLSSLTFIAVNQACVALLSYRGRFVSLVLLIVQITAMGGTFPVETAPQFFQDVHAHLPMTWTQYAIRAMIAGEGVDGAITQCLLHLALWFSVAIALVFVSAWVRAGRRPLAHDNANLADTLDSENAPFGTDGLEVEDTNDIDEAVDTLVGSGSGRHA